MFLRNEGVLALPPAVPFSHWRDRTPAAPWWDSAGVRAADAFADGQPAAGGPRACAWAWDEDGAALLWLFDISGAAEPPEPPAETAGALECLARGTWTAEAPPDDALDAALLAALQRMLKSAISRAAEPRFVPLGDMLVGEREEELCGRNGDAPRRGARLAVRRVGREVRVRLTAVCLALREYQIGDVDVLVAPMGLRGKAKVMRRPKGSTDGGADAVAVELGHVKCWVPRAQVFVWDPTLHAADGDDVGLPAPDRPLDVWDMRDGRFMPTPGHKWTTEEERRAAAATATATAAATAAAEPSPSAVPAAQPAAVRRVATAGSDGEGAFGSPQLARIKVEQYEESPQMDLSMVISGDVDMPDVSTTPAVRSAYDTTDYTMSASGGRATAADGGTPTGMSGPSTPAGGAMWGNDEPALVDGGDALMMGDEDAEAIFDNFFADTDIVTTPGAGGPNPALDSDALDLMVAAPPTVVMVRNMDGFLDDADMRKTPESVVIGSQRHAALVTANYRPLQIAARSAGASNRPQTWRYEPSDGKRARSSSTPAYSSKRPTIDDGAGSDDDYEDEVEAKYAEYRRLQREYGYKWPRLPRADGDEDESASSASESEAGMDTADVDRIRTLASSPASAGTPGEELAVGGVGVAGGSGSGGAAAAADGVTGLSGPATAASESALAFVRERHGTEMCRVAHGEAFGRWALLMTAMPRATDLSASLVNPRETQTSVSVTDANVSRLLQDLTSSAYDACDSPGGNHRMYLDVVRATADMMWQMRAKVVQGRLASMVRALKLPLGRLDQAASIEEGMHASIERALAPLVLHCNDDARLGTLYELYAVLHEATGGLLVADEPMAVPLGDVERLLVPAVHVGLDKKTHAHVSPTVLGVWEKAYIEPFGPAKKVTYFHLCPTHHEETTRSVEDFLKELSVVYATCRLGTHEPGAVPNGSMQAQSGDPIRRYREAVATLAGVIERELVSSVDGSRIVVYAVDPFMSFNTVALLGDVLAPLIRLKVAIQVLPLDYVAPARDRLQVLKDIAFSVYTKCRRTEKINTLNDRFAPSRTYRTPFTPMHTPMVETHRLDSSDMTLHSKRMYEPLVVVDAPEECTLHCTYVVTLDGAWIFVVWTDSRGELLENSILSTTTDEDEDEDEEASDEASGRSNARMGEADRSSLPVLDIWNQTREIVTHAPERIQYTQIVIAKYGSMIEAETKMWHDLVTQDHEAAPLRRYHVPRISLVSATIDRDAQFLRAYQFDAQTGAAVPPAAGADADAFHPDSADALASLAILGDASHIHLLTHREFLSSRPGAELARSFDIFGPGSAVSGPVVLRIDLSFLLELTPDGETYSTVARGDATCMHLRYLARQYHALSWLNCSARRPQRTSVLPIHIALAQRMLRLFSMQHRVE